jgi:hypothetical protein
VELQSVAGGLEDGAAVDDAKGRIHAQAQAFEQGGEVPGAPLPGMPSVLTSMKTCFGSTNAVHAALNSRHKMEWLELKMIRPFY